MVAQFRSSLTFVILVSCLIFFYDSLLGLSTGLPSPVWSKHEGGQRWNYISLATYSAASMVGSLLSAELGDALQSRRDPLTFGFMLSGIAAFFFTFAGSFPVTVVACMLKGVSTALISTFGYALLADLLGGQRAGKTMGYASMAQTLGLQFGLMIESSAHERSGRSQALLPNLILAFLILPLSFTIKEHRTRRESASVVATSNVPALMYTSSKPASMEDDDDRGSDHAEASNSGRRPSDDVETSPLLPKPAFEIHKLSALLLLRSTRFMTASIALSLLTGIQYGIIWVLPSQISSTFHLAPLQTAALFLVMILPVFLAPISGTLTDRFGAKWPAASGLIIVIPTLILLGLFGPETSMPLSKLAILLFLLGVSFMLSMPPFRAEAAKVVDGIEGSIPGASQPNRAYAKAYGLMNAFVAGGMVAGLLYMHFVCASLGWCFTSISLGLMSLVILLPVFLFVGSGSSSFEGPTIEVTQHA